MHRVRCAMLFVALALLPAAGRAQTAWGVLTGAAADGTPLAADVSFELTPTGGDLSSGLGTGSLRVVLRNRSGLVPFAMPAVGNPVATTVYFNLPAGVTLRLQRARVLPGAVLFQSGVSRTPIPGSAAVLFSGLDVTPYYELLENPSAGPFGRFTHAVSTNRGIIGGIVDSQVFDGTLRRGEIFSPLVFAGDIEFTLLVGGLDQPLDSARGLAALCSEAPGGGTAAASAAKFQGIGLNGSGSERLGDPCGATGAASSTWGGLKLRYR